MVPQVFRQPRAGPDTAAAAVCWVGLPRPTTASISETGGFTTKQLLAHFGIKSGSVSFPRRHTLLQGRAASPPGPRAYDTLALGSPDYLTAARRAEIIAERDLYRG